MVRGESCCGACVAAGAEVGYAGCVARGATPMGACVDFAASGACVVGAAQAVSSMVKVRVMKVMRLAFMVGLLFELETSEVFAVCATSEVLTDDAITLAREEMTCLIRG